MSIENEQFLQMLYIVSIKVGFPAIHHCQTDVFPLIPKGQRCCHYFAVVAEVSVGAGAESHTNLHSRKPPHQGDR